MKICISYFKPAIMNSGKYTSFRNYIPRHAGEGEQEGAGAPPAFQLGEQGEQKCPF